MDYPDVKDLGGDSGSSSDSDENEDISDPPEEPQRNRPDSPQPPPPEVVAHNLSKNEVTSESTSRPPEAQKSIAEANPGVSKAPQSLPVPPSSVPCVIPNAPTNPVQALPLLLQTPSGVGYASTPDGMILGLLQGPNIVQPQLVAIPVASVGNLAANIGKKPENPKTS
ncbi:unnamed protein product [Acanthoscelides obtectus]|uniref:Uncharacterized protein n=1 Tax=Acanthoscelides obtectus TaxID=200917 RepID=A0A9P0L4V9_ACAOB|nr:unnamed protein product [Acanthoscelides obtectus]CAK1670676.1 hypothetical protein AOBTE_LOCUS27753 [Acanthoscelides obtectus]